MLHIHFGAGRLGLGLVVPFLRRPGSRTFILNRTVSGANATGKTAIAPDRRNALLRDSPDRAYYILEPAGAGQGREAVRYDGFATYDDGDAVEQAVRQIVAGHPERDGIVVTASVLTAANYRPIIRALNALADLRGESAAPPIYLIACENTLDAHEVLADPALKAEISELAHRHVTCVTALVDRMCVGIEEDCTGAHPAVLVRAENYGSFKLALGPETEGLVPLLAGTRAEFSRHVAVEKQIKSWLLNGTHWLIALAAFEESDGDQSLKLNDYLRSPEHRAFAAEVMREFEEGIAVLLRSEPAYADFVREVDPEKYLAEAAEAILERFLVNEDTITRILARFQAPSPESMGAIQSFSKRFFERVDGVMTAYRSKNGDSPRASSQGVHSLVRLIASGSFIDAA